MNGTCVRIIYIVVHYILYCDLGTCCVLETRMFRYMYVLTVSTPPLDSSSAPVGQQYKR